MALDAHPENEYNKGYEKNWHGIYILPTLILYTEVTGGLQKKGEEHEFFQEEKSTANCHCDLCDFNWCHGTYYDYAIFSIMTTHDKSRCESICFLLYRENSPYTAKKFMRILLSFQLLQIYRIYEKKSNWRGIFDLRFADKIITIKRGLAYGK
jgi:hypothetical protein